jgi:hypothetical protein
MQTAKQNLPSEQTMCPYARFTRRWSQLPRNAPVAHVKQQQFAITATQAGATYDGLCRGPVYPEMAPTSIGDRNVRHSDSDEVVATNTSLALTSQKKLEIEVNRGVECHGII